MTSPDDDQAARPGTLWPHQWESFLRVVYAHEILGKAEIGADGLLLNIVTGGGKTAVIAAMIAWLRIAHDVQKFVMLCPNLIVRDRLEDDFEGGKVFKDRDLLPHWAHYRPKRFRPDDAWAAARKAAGRACSARASSWATSTSSTRATRAGRATCRR